MDRSNQPAPNPTRELRSKIKLTPNAPSIIALAAERRKGRQNSEIQETSSMRAVAKRKKQKPLPDTILRQAMTDIPGLVSQDGPQVDCEQAQAQDVQKDESEQEEEKRLEEAAESIKTRNTCFNLTMDRSFENLLAYDARQGSSQTEEVPDIKSPMTNGDSTLVFGTQIVESLSMSLPPCPGTFDIQLPGSPVPISGVARPIEKQNVGLDQMEGHALADGLIGGSIESAGELEVASPATKDPDGDPSKFMTQVTGEEAIDLATLSPPQRTSDIPSLGPQAAISSASRPAEKRNICLDPAIGHTLEDGLVVEIQRDSSEQNLETVNAATKDSEGGPSRITTDVTGAEPIPTFITTPPSLLLEITNVPLPKPQEIVPQYGNQEWQELQSTSEADPPVNSTAQPFSNVITIQDTDYPRTPVVPARFDDSWTRITSLLDATHRNSGMNFIIAARKDLLHGDGDAVYLHAAGLDQFEFLQRLESCLLHSNDHTPCNTGGNNIAMAERAPEMEERDMLGDGETDAETRILKELKSLLIHTAGRAGFSILDENGRLMWSTIEDVMTKEGVYLNNYPYILMPHEKRQTRGKGIQNLRVSERKRLIQALRSEVDRCQFVRLPSTQQSDIKNSKHPLIIFTPPPANGRHEQGLRYFKNGKTDQMGHPRILTELASSEEDADENDTFDNRHIVSEGLNSKSEIRDGDSNYMKPVVPRVDNYEDGQSSRALHGDLMAVNGRQTAPFQPPDSLDLKSTRKSTLSTDHVNSVCGDNESNLKFKRPRQGRVAFVTVEQSSDTETHQKNQGPVPSRTGQNRYRMRSDCDVQRPSLEHGFTRERSDRDSVVDEESEFLAQLGKTGLPRKRRASAGEENIKPKQLERFGKRHHGNSSVWHKSASLIEYTPEDDGSEAPMGSKPSTRPKSKALKKRRKIGNGYGSGSGDIESKWFELPGRHQTEPPDMEDINDNTYWGQQLRPDPYSPFNLFYNPFSPEQMSFFMPPFSQSVALWAPYTPGNATDRGGPSQ